MVVDLLNGKKVAKPIGGKYVVDDAVTAVFGVIFGILCGFFVFS